MESGALNGYLFSTSYFFEHFANWRAIHVEASQGNYDGLIKNRKTSFSNIHAALCSENKDVHLIGGGGAVSGE